MATWKVLAVVAFGGICFGLALATLVVPLALTEADYKWAWCGGLLAGTVVMSTLFALFLRYEDGKSTVGRR